MTLLITGATGRIGEVLTRTLVGRDIRVRIVTRRPHRVVELFDDRVKAFEWHPRTEPLPQDALHGVERIIHLAGEPLFGPLTRLKLDRVVGSRRQSAERLLEALGERPVHLIVASSAAVYGRDKGPPIAEDTPVSKPQERLAAAIRASEEAAEYLRENGSIVTVVRLGAVIAPGGFPNELLRLFENGITWKDDSPDATLPAIGLNDAVGLFAWLAQAPPLDGPINAVAPEPLRSTDLERALLVAAQRASRLALPRWFLRRHIGALADMVHMQRHVIPRRALDAGFAFAEPDALECLKRALPQTVSPPQESEAAPRAAPTLAALVPALLRKGKER